MLIRVQDLEVNGDKFVEMVRQEMKASKLSARKAYNKVSDRISEMGFGYPYSSFESFKVKYYEKGSKADIDTRPSR